MFISALFCQACRVKHTSFRDIIFGTSCPLRVLQDQAVAANRFGLCLWGHLTSQGLEFYICVAAPFLGMAAWRGREHGGSASRDWTQGRGSEPPTDSEPARAAYDYQKTSVDSYHVAGLACINDLPVRRFHQHFHYRLCRYADRVPLR